MRPYKSHPDVPVWLSALNGQLLTTAELDILNFIFWCNRFGCRTSNDRIGIATHRSHATVQRAVMKLYSLDLIAIVNFGKRTRQLKAVKWPDRESWQKYEKLQTAIEADAAHHAPHILPIDKTPSTRGSMGRAMESTFQVDSFSPGDCRPQPPAIGSMGVDEFVQKTRARAHRDNLIKTGWSRDKANSLARAKYPAIKFDEME